MLLLLCTTMASAHEQKVDTTANKMAKSVGLITSIDQPDFNVDGIYYNIKGSSATVEVSSTYYFTGAGWEPSPSYSGDVVIPENVTYDGETFKVIGIRGFAFYGCKNLTSVKIPVSIETVGVEAFCGCTGLTAVYIDDLAAWCNIGFATEADLPSWASPEMSSNPLSYSNKLYLKQAGQYSLLTRLYIPFGVTKINGVAFAGSDIESVTIPNSVKVIGVGAFMECTNLRSVNLSNSVTSIEWFAFGGCTGLEEIHSLSSEPATIEEDAFTSYSATLYVPGGAENAYKNDFYWKKFTNIVETVDKDLEFTIISEEDATVAVSDYTGNSSSVTIPSHYTINGKRYTVTSIGNNAFDGYTGLASIEIPNTVTSIGESAFNSCSGLTSLEIPNSVTSIGYNAFVLCTGLKSIEIPGSVTNIENSAFSSCSGLESIVVAEENTVYDSRNNCNAIIETATNTLLQGCQNTTVPNSVTGIGHSAFYLCTGLKSIEIPNSVTTIADYAFGNCEGLTSIEIPNSVTSIGWSAFEGCSGLTGELVIPNSVTSIGWSAFEGCSGLTGELVIPNSVTSIESRMFYGCSGLTGELVIPHSVTSIGSSAFGYCSGFTGELVIPNSVTNIGKGAFFGCSGLTGELVIPNSVTSIGSKAFGYCSALTSIEIPNSVASIGYDAFRGTVWFDNQPDGIVYAGKVLYAHKGTMPENTSVTVKEGTLSITDEAFNGCTGLASIEIPSSVTKIGFDAFYGCAELKTVVNFSELTISKGSSSNGYIAYYADKVINAPNGFFDGEFVWGIDDDGVYMLCSYLGNATDLTLPADCNGENYKIGDRAFYGSTGITSVEIPNSVTSIGDYAFSDCSGLTSVVIPNSVTSIGNSAFYGCSGLTGELVIPNSVTSIGERAFEDCTGLTGELVIPNGVTIIRNGAFNGCSGLTSVEIPNSIKIIEDDAFSGCSGLTSVEIPNSVTSIGSNAFERCSALTSVELPVSLRSIGEQAFDGCTSLVSVLICENVENIGAGAFNSCNKLKSITSLIPAEKLFAIPGLASLRIYRTCTLYVHIGAGETYAATEGWSRFVNIVEQDLSDIEDILGEELDNAVFYDLNGRVVEYPTNGIYIVNGKKVLVK